jgi:hypothetical protein
MAPWVDGLGRHDIEAVAVDLPRRRAEDAVEVFLEAIGGGPPSAVVLGGHSFGGRVASLAAARVLAGRGSIGGLLLLSYPLHRPGHPETWEERTAHWPSLTCPALLLSGESDPFARIELLREAVGRLPDARLLTWPRVGHGLAPVLDAAVEAAAGFVRSLPD